MTDTSRGLPERPMSPHLQVWRWHITMACSILHRACIMGLYVGVVLLAGWALSLALGPDAYTAYVGLLGSVIGKLVMIGLTFALFFNIAYTIRQSFWDAGVGFALKTADLTGAAAIAFAVVATIVTWVIANAAGAF
ncbi:MAG: succinate dehydrogenase, cytochrome b556 subunit [Alphaproteobacteria bacterium]|nr:succinate dehydrogenase, cytochrome b556 subunit [Alphaproteobacteria bacterium]